MANSRELISPPKGQLSRETRANI